MATQNNKQNNNVLNTAFLMQGAYFLITGIWPLLGMESFMAATGPKQDTWLVQMVGLLALSIGLAYVVSSLGRQRLPIVLGMAVSLSFLLMDVIYVANGVIGRIYLVDAAIQAIFLTVLVFYTVRKKI